MTDSPILSQLMNASLAEVPHLDDHESIHALEDDAMRSATQSLTGMPMLSRRSSASGPRPSISGATPHRRISLQASLTELPPRPYASGSGGPASPNMEMDRSQSQSPEPGAGGRRASFILLQRMQERVMSGSVSSSRAPSPGPEDAGASGHQSPQFGASAGASPVATRRASADRSLFPLPTAAVTSPTPTVAPAADPAAATATGTATATISANDANSESRGGAETAPPLQHSTQEQSSGVSDVPRLHSPTAEDPLINSGRLIGAPTTTVTPPSFHGAAAHGQAGGPSSPLQGTASGTAGTGLPPRSGSGSVLSQVEIFRSPDQASTATPNQNGLFSVTAIGSAGHSASSAGPAAASAHTAVPGRSPQRVSIDQALARETSSGDYPSSSNPQGGSGLTRPPTHGSGGSGDKQSSNGRQTQTSSSTRGGRSEARAAGLSGTHAVGSTSTVPGRGASQRTLQPDGEGSQTNLLQSIGDTVLSSRSGSSVSGTSLVDRFQRAVGSAEGSPFEGRREREAAASKGLSPSTTTASATPPVPPVDSKSTSPTGPLPSVPSAMRGASNPANDGSRQIGAASPQASSPSHFHRGEAMTDATLPVLSEATPDGGSISARSGKTKAIVHLGVDKQPIQYNIPGGVFSSSMDVGSSFEAGTAGGGGVSGVVSQTQSETVMLNGDGDTPLARRPSSIIAKGLRSPSTAGIGDSPSTRSQQGPTFVESPSSGLGNTLSMRHSRQVSKSEPADMKYRRSSFVSFTSSKSDNGEGPLGVEFMPMVESDDETGDEESKRRIRDGATAPESVEEEEEGHAVPDLLSVYQRITSREFSPRRRFFHVIHGTPVLWPDTIIALVFHVIVTIAILVSMITLMVETVPQYYDPNGSTGIFFIFEAVCVGIFTFEIFIRLGSALEWRNILNFQTFFDVVSILGFYIQLFIQGVSDGNFSAFLLLRLLRLLRVSRLMKLTRSGQGLQAIFVTLTRSRDGLLLLLLLTFIAVLCGGSIIYYIEALGSTWDRETETLYFDNGEKSPFQSIPHAFWFTLMTLTTVGYGNELPVSVAGQFLAVAMMICGVLLLALPNVLIGANFQEVHQSLARVKAQRRLGQYFRFVRMAVRFVRMWRHYRLHGQLHVLNTSFHAIGENTVRATLTMEQQLQRAALQNAAFGRAVNFMFRPGDFSDIYHYQESQERLGHGDLDFCVGELSAAHLLQRLMVGFSCCGSGEELFESFSVFRCGASIRHRDVVEMLCHLAQAALVQLFVLSREESYVVAMLTKAGVNAILHSQDEDPMPCVRAWKESADVWQRTTGQPAPTLLPIDGYRWWQDAQRVIPARSTIAFAYDFKTPDAQKNNVFAFKTQHHSYHGVEVPLLRRIALEWQERDAIREGKRRLLTATMRSPLQPAALGDTANGLNGTINILGGAGFGVGTGDGCGGCMHCVAGQLHAGFTPVLNYDALDSFLDGQQELLDSLRMLNKSRKRHEAMNGSSRFLTGDDDLSGTKASLENTRHPMSPKQEVRASFGLSGSLTGFPEHVPTAERLAHHAMHRQSSEPPRTGGGVSSPQHRRTSVASGQGALARTGSTVAATTTLANSTTGVGLPSYSASRRRSSLIGRVSPSSNSNGVLSPGRNSSPAPPQGITAGAGGAGAGGGGGAGGKPLTVPRPPLRDDAIPSISVRQPTLRAMVPSPSSRVAETSGSGRTDQDTGTPSNAGSQSMNAGAGGSFVSVSANGANNGINNNGECPSVSASGVSSVTTPSGVMSAVPPALRAAAAAVTGAGSADGSGGNVSPTPLGDDPCLASFSPRDVSSLQSPAVSTHSMPPRQHTELPPSALSKPTDVNPSAEYRSTVTPSGEPSSKTNETLRKAMGSESLNMDSTESHAHVTGKGSRQSPASTPAGQDAPLRSPRSEFVAGGQGGLPPRPARSHAPPHAKVVAEEQEGDSDAFEDSARQFRVSTSPRHSSLSSSQTPNRSPTNRGGRRVPSPPPHTAAPSGVPKPQSLNNTLGGTKGSDPLQESDRGFGCATPQDGRKESMVASPLSGSTVGTSTRAGSVAEDLGADAHATVTSGRGLPSGRNRQGSSLTSPNRRRASPSIVSPPVEKESRDASPRGGRAQRGRSLPGIYDTSSDDDDGGVSSGPVSPPPSSLQRQESAAGSPRNPSGRTRPQIQEPQQHGRRSQPSPDGPSAGAGAVGAKAQAPTVSSSESDDAMEGLLTKVRSKVGRGMTGDKP